MEEKDIEKIKNFARLMGKNPKETEKIINFANTVGAMKRDEFNKESNALVNNNFSEEINILKASIPFINREYQRDLFVIVKLMEIKDGDKTIVMQEKNGQENMYKRRTELLKAVRPYLKSEEKEQADIILKAMQIKALMNNLGGN